MTYVPVGTQVDVITTGAPVAIVLGGAGTGKTTTAAAACASHLRAADAAREQQRRDMTLAGNVARLPPRARALFLSFSRTAVAQIIDRAADVLGPLMDRIDVLTFDGLAWRIVSDFGASYGYPSPLRIASETERKVLGTSAGMRYDDLIPAAHVILANPTVAAHYARRYSLVICDEFQDTDDEEWHFLQTVAPRARRILLGDLNQCIYAELKKIDPEARIAQALALPGALRIDLPAASHRDPSGVLPAAADAARARRFTDPALAAAVAGGRLVVDRTSDEGRVARVLEIVQQERGAGHSVSVFTHTNVAATELSDALSAANLRHEQVGLSESYGEALNAQFAMLRYALDGSPGGRAALAVFIASNYRGTVALPQQVLDRSNPAFERALKCVAGDLTTAGAPLDVDRLGEVIAEAYTRLGTHRGQRTWSEAARQTRGAVRLLAQGQPLANVEEHLQRARHNALLGDTGVRPHPVQVMNLHQTKGREADATVLLLQPDEYHGREPAPYPTLSRLLYVVLTRARKRAYIVVPGDVHPLWRPLVEACEAVTTPAAGCAPL
ncbi:UvrD-helicase domain-containing protein [Sporichthya polymorpha]|uniref:UvrD-helicase domain-containing protein n=1 Tax=Sporichthya polymorpha TaxID=35751 RepID=UPI0003829FDF|nr:UvrD-helicase domain-containing protein [Sporichthya polymorpha]